MRAIESLVQKTFNSLGLHVSRKGTHVRLGRRVETVVELEAVYRHFLFPRLRSVDGRHELMAKLEGTQIGEAIHILQCLNDSLALDGDVCEFGVAQGSTSALMANEIRDTTKNLWLFDSFEGLPRPTDKDKLIDDVFNLGDIGKYEGKMAHGKHEVLQRLTAIKFPLERVKIVPGFIEKTINNPGLPEKVCFAYLDFDFYEPLKIAMEFLNDRLASGGYMLIDDYGWFSSGAATAVDEFAAAHADRFALTKAPAFSGHFAMLQKLS